MPIIGENEDIVRYNHFKGVYHDHHVHPDHHDQELLCRLKL